MHQIVKILKFLSIIVICVVSCHAKDLVQETKVLDFQSLPVAKRIKDSIESDSPYAKSEISSVTLESSKEGQALDYLIAGLHKKNCQTALSKLSQYERYKEFIGFVKASQYKNQYIKLHLSHTLMPYDMMLEFKIERIRKPGVYLFAFETGFLKGLKGQINISEFKNRCFFATTAHWRGPDSGIPNTLFSFFSKALGKLAMERLFRISETR